MSISEREKLVLNAIVNYYLTFGDTIGSRTLVKKYGIDLSSATIRNVMADLEDMGYISKTHTSSGRIPTDKGYKYYLDELLKVEKLTKEEKNNIELEYEHRVNELDLLLQKTSSLLSKMTTYAGIAIEPSTIVERIKKIELVHIDEFLVLAVIVTENRAVKTKKIMLDQSISKEELEVISRELNTKVANHEINFGNIEKFILGKKLLTDDIEQYEDDSKFFINNVPSIFKDKNVNEVSEVLELFHHRKDIKLLFEQLVKNRDSSYGKVNVVFGEELGIKGLEDYSFVYSLYKAGSSQGILGVIGPKRMAYSKTMGLIKYVTQEVNKILNKIERKDETNDK
ncbi:heat-inducible transcriptional repressor HrcA [Fusobacterium ulcerans]|jgi:heat-inducible transcriptional repressor|uniref:heat-inducible transcriptional repressor HrcA n=1 Tax=Fusobacterium ulcerans TaxID=861 RepID=UPI000E52AAC2|nr:heat-inducible transcriptional repressor HrcA [Fusobacterium ulcerans]MEE0139059.1 heat-inducible transcriptional repressor HrcA [Fusobacterium ulcerans]RGY64755.1 heat-inducible transcription repressor HrcA [Fusobacterium ulcerans]HJH07598.1 heat-inducible transcriptional repressor HrcA [Fusobacterium ulcerans]